MLPPPPRSTLFPYTTLFRSVESGQIDIHANGGQPIATHLPGHFSGDIDLLTGRPVLVSGIARGPTRVLRVAHGDLRALRSEEHTSELQSPVHLVCRLLLEKK